MTEIFEAFFSGLITAENIAYMIILYTFLRGFGVLISVGEDIIRKQFGVEKTVVQVVNGASADSDRNLENH